MTHLPTPFERFIQGILPENPVYRQLLGLCPTLAVTSGLKPALTMAAAVAAFRARKQPHIVQVFEVGTATMMAAQGAVYPVEDLMKGAGEPFDANAFLPAVISYYQTPDVKLLSMPLNSSAGMMSPRKQPSMMRHEAIRVYSRNTAPIRQASVDTSPIEPCICPTNACVHVRPLAMMPDTPSIALIPSAVAPLKPSTAVQTASPEISAG